MSRPKAAPMAPAVLKLAPGTYQWCTCGESCKKPFCDGSHEGTGCLPMEFEITEERKVALCRCGLTATPPFCDGTHNKT